MDPESKEQEIIINTNRASIYSFLSGIYARELTSEQISELRSRRGNLLPSLSLGSGDGEEATQIMSGLDLIRKYFESVADGSENDVRLDLAEDYAGLFLGVRGKIPHPSESAYQGGRKIMARPYRQVLKIYEDAGLSADKSFTEPEDHVATELSFMAFLAKKTSESIKNRDYDSARRLLGSQEVFLERHLTKWLPTMCNDVLEIGRTDFYKGVAKITMGFLGMDNSILKDLTR
ncbi:MAG: molecular chaperone TorD family protein [Nitrososphaerales archaeon]